MSEERFWCYSIDELKAKNANSGFYFFSRFNMRFFHSRICPTIYGGRYFITSEEYPYAGREYRVRHIQENWSIDTVGDGYISLAAAKAAVKEQLFQDKMLRHVIEHSRK